MDLGFNLKLLTSLVPLLSGWNGGENDRRCLALKSGRNLENTTILNVAYVPGDTTVKAHGPCDETARVSVPLCRVEFLTQTSASSSIRAEAWLPDEWYGRFLAAGNGGLGGCISYSMLDYGSQTHFATVASNNGHDGDGGLAFLDKEVLNDFAFRSIHTEAVIGKQILEAYYGRPHNKAYYVGCSTGGRQGMQSALKYPEDFDGIIAGAPNPRSSPSFIPPELWKVVAAEVLAQCDAADGLRDGIITEPDTCTFRPEVLLCRDGSTRHTKCLTTAQVDALHEIYNPLYYDDPGSENIHLGGATFIGEFPRITQDWFRYAVLNGTEFDFSEYGPEEGRLMDEVDPGGIATFEGNMSAFRDRGGKFLTYHGRADPFIPSRPATQSACTTSSRARCSRLASTRSTVSSSCLGWRTASAGRGQQLLGSSLGGTNARNASSHNVLLALVDWVEGGPAPQTIVGTAEDGAERAHCRYPMRSVWDSDEERFGCKINVHGLLPDSSSLCKQLQAPLPVIPASPNPPTRRLPPSGNALRLSGIAVTSTSQLDHRRSRKLWDILYIFFAPSTAILVNLNVSSHAYRCAVRYH
ncbi:tannase and feruloyl esterase [Mycena polygramma]|nr:tannase and feruloyl esterase [Mycena polygramma]